MTHDWKNYYLDNRAHHITGTVHQWQPALLCAEVLDIFYDEYNQLSETYEIKTIGYVIMPEHFHVLTFSTRGENIRIFLQSLRRRISGKVRHLLIEKQASPIIGEFESHGVEIARFYSKTARKSEFRFWKEKPRVFPMNHVDAIIKKLNYIHQNPVRRSLVADAADWEHSSVHYYVSGKRGRIPISSLPSG
jgi:putative transposase